MYIYQYIYDRKYTILFPDLNGCVHLTMHLIFNVYK